MFSRKLTRVVAAVAAAVAVAIGGFAIGNSSSNNGSSGTPTTNAAATTGPAARPGYGPRAGQGAQSGQAPQSGQPNQASKAPVKGQIPKGWQPGSGTIITGASADKAKAVAIAAGYKGTVNRVLQLSDGSYVVHIIANPSGPHHVFVSKDFKVVGSE